MHANTVPDSQLDVSLESSTSNSMNKNEKITLFLKLLADSLTLLSCTAQIKFLMTHYRSSFWWPIFQVSYCSCLNTVWCLKLPNTSQGGICCENLCISFWCCLLYTADTFNDRVGNFHFSNSLLVLYFSASEASLHFTNNNKIIKYQAVPLKGIWEWSFLCLFFTKH